MSGRRGVHGNCLVHAPIVGACSAGVVTATAFTLVQVPTRCSGTCGVVKIFAYWGFGVPVGGWSGS